MFNNKKGIELSINFVVMLIFGLMVFIVGIAFATRLFSSVEEMRGEIDSQTEMQIEQLLMSGQPVALPLNTVTLKAGKTHIFGMGISNIAEEPYDFCFYVNDGTCSGECTGQNQLLEHLPGDSVCEPIGVIGANEQKKQRIAVQMPKTNLRGTYVLDVEVYGIKTADGSCVCAGDLYGGVKKKIYIKRT
ncbi:hypothetical protein ACFL0W_04495 [Nanoarchaeota archaeon]